MKAFIIALVLTQNENYVLLYTAVKSIVALTEKYKGPMGGRVI